ncbi:hypothetical protein ACFSJQ_21260 [Vibrio olivae]|uniref:Uncharacterized protein n=1 Tax=Vibrio olivae TaxID=1243002 RepID=A0ABV5HU92_9VIBR
MKKRVWTVLESGDEAEFSRLIKSNFGDALVDEFYEEMTYVYETLPNRNREKFEKEIVKKGSMLLPVAIKTVGSKHEGNPDSCGTRVSHSKLQAVVVIPQKATDRMYRWFKCPSTEFPHLFIKLKINGLTLDDEIQVIGVSREGQGKSVELRVTQSVGKRFNLPGWEKYESNASGYFNVTRASF